MAVCVLVITACGQAGPGPSPAVDTGPVPAGLERFYAQQLSWGGCSPFATTELDEEPLADPRAECARLEAPLDYAAPAGETVQIGVLRVRTSNPKIGSLLLNPGGPGSPGMSLAVALAPFIGDGSFDLVGFDPRGVGASTPAVNCGSDAEMDPEMSEMAPETSAVSAAEDEAATREIVEQCTTLSGGVDVLANIGTRDVARDLDVLRAVLGDRKLTYLGYSYGTRIGTAYAEMFPGNVRALVLDGAVNPTQTAAQELLAQFTAFQAAFDVYTADCTRMPDCPLGSDPVRATAAFQALTRPLITAPVLAEDGIELTYPDAITAVVGALYDPTMWPVLTMGLRELRSGDGTTLLNLADAYYAGGGSEAMIAIDCVDKDRVTDRAAAAEATRRINAAAPFQDPGIAPIAALDFCALWPVPPTTAPHQPRVEGLPPTLVVSVTGDPATPYADGVALAQQLRGRLLTVEGTQHTAAIQGHSCVDTIVVDYLVDLTLPPEGARCTLPPSSATGGS